MVEFSFNDKVLFKDKETRTIGWKENDYRSIFHPDWVRLARKLPPERWLIDGAPIDAEDDRGYFHVLHPRSNRRGIPKAEDWLVHEYEAVANSRYKIAREPHKELFLDFLLGSFCGGKALPRWFHDLISDLWQYEYLMMHNPAYTRYRDHTWHQFRVWCVGRQLLASGCDVVDDNSKIDLRLRDDVELDTRLSGNANQGVLLDRVAHLINESPDLKTRLGTRVVTRDLVLRAWNMAALIHDVGYAYEFLYRSCESRGEIGDRTELRLCRPTLMNKTGNQCWDLLRGWVRQFVKLDTKELGRSPVDPQSSDTRQLTVHRERFVDYVLDNGHAGMSAYSALQLFQSSKEGLVEDYHADAEIVSRLAAWAILWHDVDHGRRLSDKPNELKDRLCREGISPACHLKRQVVFKDDPLSFLLILCDQMQDWGRYTMCGRPPDKLSYDCLFDSVKVKTSKEGGWMAFDSCPATGRAVNPIGGKEASDQKLVRESRHYFDGQKSVANTTGFVEVRAQWEAADRLNAGMPPSS